MSQDTPRRWRRHAGRLLRALAAARPPRSTRRGQSGVRISPPPLHASRLCINQTSYICDLAIGGQWRLLETRKLGGLGVGGIDAAHVLADLAMKGAERFGSSVQENAFSMEDRTHHQSNRRSQRRCSRAKPLRHGVGLTATPALGLSGCNNSLSFFLSTSMIFSLVDLDPPADDAHRVQNMNLKCH